MIELITCGTGPDLDGLASALGYAELLRSQGGRDVVVGFEGLAQLDAEFFIQRFNLALHSVPEKFDRVRVVDCSALSVVPIRVQEESHKVVEVIDHRRFSAPKADFPRVEKVLIHQVGACSTLITEKILRSAPSSLSRDVAMLLYAGILSNTLDFNAYVTTDRDREAAQALIEKFDMGRESAAIAEEMFRFRTDLDSRQLQFALKNDFQSLIESPEGLVGVAQIEVLDAMELLKSHGESILHALRDLKQRDELDFIFLTMPSISQGVNYLLAVDPWTVDFLRRYLAGFLAPSYEVFDQCLVTQRLLLRKEIVPVLYRAPDQRLGLTRISGVSSAV